MRQTPTTVRTFVLAPALLALCACGSQSSPDDSLVANDPEATATATAAVVAQDVTQLPLTAEAFIDAMTASNNFEIESARIVQAIGPGEPLTDFTQMMIREHQTMKDGLVKATNVAPGGAVDDQKLTAEQEAQLEALRSAPTPQMLELYKRQQIEAHKKALAMLQTYAASGDNQELMQLAGRSIPIINRHLAEAQQLP